MIGKAIHALLAVVMVCAGAFALSTSTASAATPCVPEWDIVIGGLNDNQSTIFTGSVDQRVNYNSYILRTGIDEAKRLIKEHRSACPADHISLYGYSGGAATAHVTARELGPQSNFNVVLLSDPKQAKEQGIGPGFAATDPPFMFYPDLAGADANFGGNPTFRDCVKTDHICNSQASWSGYPGEHGKYAFDVDLYSNTGNSLRVR